MIPFNLGFVKDSALSQAIIASATAPWFVIVLVGIYIAFPLSFSLETINCIHFLFLHFALLL